MTLPFSSLVLNFPPGSRAASAAHPMDISPMLDCVFELSEDPQGAEIPFCYRQPLWIALVSVLPWLIDETRVGVHPLKLMCTGGAGVDAGPIWQLGHRGRLILRLPELLLDEVHRLSGQVLTVGTAFLRVGNFHIRPLTPASTLSAEVVVMGLQGYDEKFLREGLMAEMATLAVRGRLVCGTLRAVDADVSRYGYSVRIHDLSPDDSIRLQQVGLGRVRHLGCGILVPARV